jgi:hypothetical protein
MTGQSFRDLQQAVQQTEDVFGHSVPYVYFSRYGDSTDMADTLQRILGPTASLETIIKATESLERFRQHIVADMPRETELQPTESAVIDFLRRYNHACVDAFVLGRAAELAGLASTHAQSRARQRAFGLVRRALEQNGLTTSSLDNPQPPLDDETTVKALSWGRVLGLALTYEDVYALAVSSLDWETLVSVSPESSGFGGLISRLLRSSSATGSDPLPPLPALPEPTTLPALPSE